MNFRVSPTEERITAASVSNRVPRSLQGAAGASVGGLQFTGTSSQQTSKRMPLVITLIILPLINNDLDVGRVSSVW